MFTECIGPSLYAAKQGRPVKVWGLLYKAHLCTHVLLGDASTKRRSAHVKQIRFQKMFRLHAKRWPRECNKGRSPHRGQAASEYDRCLWADRSLEVFRSNHLHTIMGHTLNNQDVNAPKDVRGHFRKKLNACVPCSGHQCH